MGAYASEKITIADSVIGFTAATVENGIINKPYEAFFVVETAAFRYTVDGSTPSTTVGLLASVGDVITISGEHDIKNFKAIRTGGTSAVIQPQFDDGTESTNKR